ncbi:FAD binding domain-containing protein, partial [Chloroflexota bacterium]
ARVKLTGTNGERIVPLEDYFTGPGTTILQTGELLVEIQVPTCFASKATASSIVCGSRYSKCTSLTSGLLNDTSVKEKEIPPYPSGVVESFPGLAGIHII